MIPPLSPQRRLNNIMSTRWRRVFIVIFTTFSVVLLLGGNIDTTCSHSSLFFVSAFVAGPKVTSTRTVGGGRLPRSIRRDNHNINKVNKNNRKRQNHVCLNAVGKTGGRLIETIQEYEESVLNCDASQKPIMVFFTAPWCGPCRLSVPAVKDVMKEFTSELDCVEVCTDDLPEVAADSGVVSIPTIQLYFAGNVVDTIVGCVAKTVLASSVEKVLEDIQLKAGKKKKE